MPVDTPSHAVAGNAYLGSDLCGSCHPDQFHTQPSSPMAGAMVPAAEAPILQAFPVLEFRQDPFRYRVENQGDQVLYTVSDGSTTLSEPLQWAFGVGEFGQTYLFERRGRWVESRVSFYPTLSGLDLTVGAPVGLPRNLEEALGQPLQPVFARRCFACHSTGSVLGRELQVETLMPGITCEGCHGPGGNHLAAVESGRTGEPTIYNPARWSADEIISFCGTCHRTLEEVIGENMRGPITARFQPYRLVLSPCYSPTDPRISCIACHDPHRPRSREASSYDDKCATCHGSPAAGSGSSAGTTFCPVETEGCTDCHMPAVPVPTTHFTFTDHFIHFVKPGEAYARQAPAQSGESEVGPRQTADKP